VTGGQVHESVIGTFKPFFFSYIFSVTVRKDRVNIKALFVNHCIGHVFRHIPLKRLYFILVEIDGSYRIMKIYHPVAVIITARAFAWTRTMKLFSDMTKQYLTYTHQKWIFSNHKIRALFFYALIMYLRNMYPFFFTLFSLKLVDESLTRIMSNRQFSLIKRLF